MVILASIFLFIIDVGKGLINEFVLLFVNSSTTKYKYLGAVKSKRASDPSVAPDAIV
jgi:hypothetical protein